jgi:hypothetical protein
VMCAVLNNALYFLAPSARVIYIHRFLSPQITLWATVEIKLAREVTEADPDAVAGTGWPCATSPGPGRLGRPARAGSGASQRHRPGGPRRVRRLVAHYLYLRFMGEGVSLGSPCGTTCCTPREPEPYGASGVAIAYWKLTARVIYSR